MATSTLKKSLSSKKSWVTRLINECNQIIGSDQLTPNKLSRAVDNLKTKWHSYLNTYEVLEAKVIEAANDKEYDELLKEHEDKENNYLKELNKFETKLEELNTAVTINKQNVVEPPKLTLPVMKLPEFAGIISEWPAFWDKFNGLIHQRNDIAKINKFSYLLGQLKDTAYLVVSQLAVTEDNYDIALKLLKDNYEDKDQITANLVNKLFDLPIPKHTYDELQLFRVTVNSILESLRLHKNVDAASWLLQIIVERKLTKKTKDTLYYKYSRSHFTLEEIDQTLLEICKTLATEEPIKTVKKDTSATINPQNPQNRKKTAFTKAKNQKDLVENPGSGRSNNIGSYTTMVNKSATASSSNTNSTGARPKTIRKCIFCAEQHNSIDCDKYKGKNNRLERLSQLGRCTICLSGYHQVQNCRTKLNKCFQCKRGIHHIVLCDMQENATNESPSQSNNTLNCPAAVPIGEVQVTNQA